MTSLLADANPAAEILELAHPLSRALESLERPCSLCELGLGPEDYAFLLQWAAQLQPHRVDQWLYLRRVHPKYEASAHEALGLLLLIVASEVGRRNAHEGDLWHHVEACFPHASRRLFAQTQPRTDVKASLQAAVQRFQLHHAFGEDGTQAYYTTVFMQFGFTAQGLSRLPVWLAHSESQPVAVRRLLERSAPFRGVWEALRKGQQPSSPFLLASWEVPARWNWPRLDWNGHGEPRFLIGTDQLLPPAEGAYLVTLEGSEDSLWVFLEKGTWEPAELPLTPRGPHARVTVSRHELDDQPVTMEIDLWDPEEALAFYAASDGSRKPCRPGVPGAVLVEQGWEPCPPADNWRRLPGIPWTLHYFGAGLPPAQVFKEGGEVVWSLEASAPPALPPLSLVFNKRLICVLPEEVKVTIDGLPPGAEIVHLKHQGRLVEKNRVRLDHDLMEPALKLALAIRWQGHRYRKTVSAELQMEAATLWRGSEWEGFEYLEELEAREVSVRFLLPEQPFGLVEGDLFLGRPRSGPLRGLAGYGAPLRLLHGPYGLQEKLPRLLAETVVNRGGIVSANWEPSTGLTLRFRRPLNPDDERRVVLWNEQQGLSLLPSTRFAALGDLWTAPLESPPRAVALEYKGRRLGSHWGVPGEWIRTPSLARWFHLPLLQPAFREHWQSQPVSTLRAWLTDTKVGELEHTESEGWLSVVRAYFGEWKPGDVDLAREALQAVGYPALLSVSPLLAFRIVRDALPPAEHRELCQDLLRLPANKQSPADRQSALVELRESAAREMGVAAPYLLALEGNLHEKRADDLLLALANPHFQQYLLARLMVRLAWSE